MDDILSNVYFYQLFAKIAEYIYQNIKKNYYPDFDNVTDLS